MTKNKFLYLIIILFLITLNIKDSYSEDSIEIEVVANCGKTQGGIATATPEGIIYYCAQRMASIEYKYPRASNFFILHEYAHIYLNSGNELQVDCWTANELANSKDTRAKITLESATQFIRDFYKLPDPKYGGTGKQRSNLIKQCAKHGSEYYKKVKR